MFIVVSLALLVCLSHQLQCYKCSAEATGGNCYSNNNEKDCNYCVFNHVLYGQKPDTILQSNGHEDTQMHSDLKRSLFEISVNSLYLPTDFYIKDCIQSKKDIKIDIPSSGCTPWTAYSTDYPGYS